MYIWTDDAIRWLSDAAVYSGYYGKLAVHIAKYLPERTNICDMGCGLGFLAEELSKYAAGVTAIDINEKALSVLGKKHIAGVAAICCDALTHTPDVQYDAAVFCFFGEPGEILSQMERHIAKKLIIIKSETPEHNFTLKEVPERKHMLGPLIEEFDARKIEYVHESFVLEFGQPFSSIEDATAFFRHYGGYDDPNQITGKTIEPLLIQLDDPVFPFYREVKKNIGMVVLNDKKTYE